jgi:CsoR family transcriptional regulator, copper-sensing transcriptional repressor
MNSLKSRMKSLDNTPLGYYTIHIYPVGVYWRGNFLHVMRGTKTMTISGEEKKKILTRLRRIEGQTRGIQRMVEEDKYCVDIMTQIAGVQSALEQVSLLLMENHLLHCVSEAMQEGKGEEKIAEIMEVIKHYARA